MPLTDQTYAEARRENPLEITASDYYFNTMRPYLEQMLAKCRTDPELTRTIEKTMNAADSFCAAKDYAAVSDSFEVLNTAISDKGYFNGAMKRGTEEGLILFKCGDYKIGKTRTAKSCHKGANRHDKELSPAGGQRPDRIYH